VFYNFEMFFFQFSTFIKINLVQKMKKWGLLKNTFKEYMIYYHYYDFNGSLMA